VYAIAWSSNESPSRRLPSAPRASNVIAAGLEGDALGEQDAGELALDLRGVEPAQVELQAARQHGDRQLLRVGGREQELDVARRLLERLEQRVERALGQHVHLVDEVHLGAAARRHVLRVLDQRAHVVDAGVAGRVDLEQVDEAAGVDVAAGVAFAARFGVAPCRARSSGSWRRCARWWSCRRRACR
jgi:hypothetical protein